MTSAPRPRLLVFVIAYFAEKTLRKVLDRIPQVIFEQYDAEVLVVDDASNDRTFEIGNEYKREHPELRMTVLRNEYNQGYGGNQKVGYTFAISEGFDFVAMVHGDGQYAPEELPRLVQPLRDGAADAVFGSRMLTPFGALKGGMPLYKWVGNQILTRTQNAFLGTRLSEFHSGYRIYSTAALRRVQYLLNSNDFHFDTEIIIQFLNAGLRIEELPIPTYYGDEVCRVNGMKYAKDVMLATLRNVGHRAGILYQRRFDPVTTGEIFESPKLGYPSSHQWALDAVPGGAKVLEFCSIPGGLSAELSKKGCAVSAVDPNAPATPPEGVKVYRQELDETKGYEVKPHDVLLMLDVIEHVHSPERFMESLRSQFDYRPRKLLLTTPNIAFFIPRLMLLAGQFNYGRAGILARSHHRLFTFRSIKHLLRDNGYRVKDVRGVPAPFPKVFGNGWLGKAAIGANLALIRLSRTLFAYQIYVEAESTPNVDFILRDSKERASEPPSAPPPMRARVPAKAGPAKQASKAKLKAT